MLGITVSTVLFLCIAAQKLDVPITRHQNAEPLNVQCEKCTYITDNTFYSTDETGKILTKFRCDSSPAATKFCADPTLLKIDFFSPELGDVCKSLHQSQVCLKDALLPVTVWGDGRLDPNYVTATKIEAAELTKMRNGDYRDMFSHKYAFLTTRTKATPETPYEAGIWGPPDLYAWWDSSPIHVLMGTGPALPPWTPAADERTRLQNLPVFENKNEVLFMYFGHDTDKLATEFGSCNKGHLVPKEGNLDGTDTSCPIKELQEYLTTHRDITTYHLPDVVAGSVTFGGTNAAVMRNRQLSYNDRQKCGTKCFVDMTTDNNRLVLTPVTWSGQSTVYGVSTPSPISTVAYIPAGVTDANGWAVFELSIRDDSGFIPYPFLLFPQHGPYETVHRNAWQWIEESPDGINWSPHPETVSPNLVKIISHYPSGEWPPYFQWRWNWLAKPNHWNHHRRVVSPTGKNKYLRMVGYQVWGDWAHGPITPRKEIDHWVMPTHILSAKTRKLTSLIVAPSLSTKVKNVPEVTGQDHCKNIVQCTYIEFNGDDGFYPKDSTAALPDFGSPRVRRFMGAMISPLLHECQMLLDDPVKKFLTYKKWAKDDCYRMGESANKLTCYNYRPNTYTSSTPNVRTDVLNTYVEYDVPGITLRVSTLIRRPRYAVPVMIIGPFTLQNPVNATFYVYNVPVQGSRKLGNLYITREESCQIVKDQPPRLPADESCECIDYPIHAIYCLCKSGEAYKTLAPIPNGLTFKYPFFFTPRKFPTDYVVSNQQASFDSGAYSRINIDCPSYLCANNKMCRERFYDSNYLKFCEDQKKIVTTTLNSLDESIGNIDIITRKILESTKTPAGINMTDIPYLANAPPPKEGNNITIPPEIAMTRARSNVFSSFSRSASNYMSKISTETFWIENQLGVDTGGYHYQTPWTTPWEATGISIFASAGVGVLTQKINTLALNNAVVTSSINSIVKYANTLADGIESLSKTVQEAMRNSMDLSVQLSENLNSAIQEVNQRFDSQTSFNKKVSQQLNQLATATADLTTSVNYLDIVGSRASTFGIQVSAIMIKALDYELKAKQFGNRIAACLSDEDAYICTGSAEAKLIGSMIKKTGTLTTIHNLILKPSSYYWAYTTPEFCYEGQHYLVRSKSDVFVLLGGQMYISPTNSWAPRNITDENTIRLMVCRDAEMSIQDLTPNLPIVELEPEIVQMQPNFTMESIVAAVLDNLTVADYGGMIAKLNASIQAINITFPDLVLPNITSPFLYPPASMSLFDKIMVVIMGIIGVVVVIGIVSLIFKMTNCGKPKYFRV